MEDHIVSAANAIQSINRVELSWLLWVIYGLEPEESPSVLDQGESEYCETTSRVYGPLPNAGESVIANARTSTARSPSTARRGLGRLGASGHE